MQQVQELPLDAIKPYIKNPRKIQNAVGKVAASIKRFGFRQPILVDKDKVIIAGHVRYAAAKQLGMQRVPVIVCSDLTPAQVKAYRLADNKTAEEATWDVNLLAEELGAIKDFDMKEFGFTDFMINFDTGAEDILTNPEQSRKTPQEVEPISLTCPKCGYTWEI